MNGGSSVQQDVTELVRKATNVNVAIMSSARLDQIFKAMHLQQVMMRITH